MNAPLEPLPPEVVDELLSAELDGEFDTAARDLGFEPETARRALAATAGSADRRAQLIAAQQASSVVTPMSDRLRQGIVDTALVASAPAEELVQGRFRRHRVLSTIGSVAAALAVVLGIGALLGDNTSSSGDDASTSALEQTSVDAAPGDGAVVTGLGDVSEPALLRRQVREALRLRSPSELDNSRSGAEGSDASPTSKSNDSAFTTSTADAPSSTKNAAKPARCEPRLRKQLDLGELAFVAPARYRGSDVNVYVFERVDGYFAIVVDDACDLRATQPVR